MDGTLLGSGETAAHLAAAHGQTEVLCLLLSGGADPSALDEDGLSPVHAAAAAGHAPALWALLGSSRCDKRPSDLRAH